MSDDWEAQADATPSAAEPAARKPLALRPDAPTFSLNPAVREFVPTWAPPAQAPEASSLPPPADASPPEVDAALVAQITAVAVSDEAAAVVPPSAATADAVAPDTQAADNNGPAEEDVEISPEDTENDAEEEHHPTTEDPREHLNLVFIGHVDAGKSTLSGSILLHTGQIDARAIEKFEREAKAKGRDSWYIAFIMDTTEEERTKGITVEVGRATFETANKRFTILDAPGHKNYVPNMITGASQADVGILVISARKGEFETGFEKGGQTREHALLAKTLGVKYLVVAINKMDEPTIIEPGGKWSKTRYDDIVAKLTPFLRQSGYNIQKHVTFLPISGIIAGNLKERVSKEVCAWYDGPALLEVLDSFSIPGRDPSGPLRIPILDKYINRGVIVMGKVESGTLREGQKVAVYPQNTEATVDTIYINDVEVGTAKPGENVRLRVKFREGGEENFQRGFVIVEKDRPMFPVRQFEAQLIILELEAHSLFTPGYSAVLHVHTAQEEITVKQLVAELDKKTGQPIPAASAPRFIKSGGTCMAILEVAQAICVEKYDTMQQLGRFTLRDGMRTIAIGKITKLGIQRSQREEYQRLYGGGASASVA